MLLKKCSSKFDTENFWYNPIDIMKYEMHVPMNVFIDPFDQNGYDMCLLELEYAAQHDVDIHSIRSRQAIANPWYIDADNLEGVHVNHALLFQRKGFAGYALEQLFDWSDHDPFLWKLIKIKPKWGIDISFDYVDRKGNCFEVFHYEWDDFSLEPVLEMKDKVETIIDNTDWSEVAKVFLKRRDEWQDLNFFEQSKWKAQYLGLPEEQFKMVLWDK